MNDPRLLPDPNLLPDPARHGRYVIRPLAGHDEFARCVAFQEAVWGEGFAERVPGAILMVAQRLGGLVAGAFDGDEMVAFVFGLTGVERGEPVHWSDMLAVRSDLRDEGLGLALKRYQGRVMLERGVRRVRWTFDPLESRNAWLNLHKLGATAPEYHVDLYGASNSPLHAGIGTDRFVVCWRLDAPHVRAFLENESSTAALGSGAQEPPAAGRAGPTAVRILAEAAEPHPAGPAPGVPAAVDALTPAVDALTPAVDALAPESDALDPECDALVAIPADIQAIKAADAGLAGAWRAATRAALQPLV
ncbi:MAG: hypothetical protein D6701_03030, partial [Gemmatimonadetes bacterium]